MVTISSKLLKSLAPEFEGVSHAEFSDLFAKTQLEIDTVEQIENDSFNVLYQLKPICDFRTFSGLWILVKELRLSLDKNYQKVSTNLFGENFLETETLLKDLFGPKLNSPVSQFLMKDFCSENPSFMHCIDKCLVSRENLGIVRPKSLVNLSTLLPIFDDLKKDWEGKVIPKLQASNWEFTRENDDSWTVYWPPWYSQETLPPFSEILGRLIPLDQSKKPIRESHHFSLVSVNRPIRDNFLDKWSLIRNYLIEKGFIECNTSKFLNSSKNLKQQNYCLNYSKELTLRDNLHYTLIFDVLLKNFNNKKKLYPVFELSYCPWNSCWLLGLASSIELRESRDTNNFWYGLREFVDFLIFIFQKFLIQELEFDVLEKGEYLPPFSGALVYRLMVRKKVLGQIIIHRLEQFEIRKKELISASLKIPHFS